MRCGQLLFLAILLFCPLSGLAASPNIILITLDTTRADRMGFLGSKRGLTPNLDVLARHSMVFTRAYAHVPLTTPSHATMLTGTYPQFNNVSDLGTPLAPDLPYVPEILRGKGYSTAAFLGAIVLDQKVGGAPGFDRGFDRYDAGFHRRAKQESRYQSMERRAGAVVERAVNWLNRQRPGRPFFIWIHLYDAHDPYDPPEPYKSRFSGDLYDGEIAYTDSVVGRLFGILRERGLYDGSLIAVAADHGEAFGEHGEQRHGIFLYDETIRVPLLLKLPASHSSRRVDSRVGLVDVAPTLLQAAAINIPSAMQGKALQRLASPAKSPEDRPQYAETNYSHRAFGWSTIRSWRAGKYLYVQAPKRELYDQSSDQKTDANIAGSSAPVADVLSAQLDKFFLQTSRSNSGAKQLDEAQAENLRALGYLGTEQSTVASESVGGVDPKDKIAVANLLHEALIALEEDDGYKQAISLLEEVVKQDPSIPVAYLELGRAQRKLKDYAHAVPSLQRAAELNPESAPARYEAGMVYVETRNWPEAAKQFEAAVALNPKSPEFHTYLAVVYERLHRIEDASKEFRTTLEFDPENYKASLFLGRLLAMNGDPASALPHLKKAAKLQPQAPEPHQFLANTYSELGQTQDALRENAEAIRLTSKTK
jgi:arylsulfatase A-like enzyme/Tfp pilus assembly protein PilF